VLKSRDLGVWIGVGEWIRGFTVADPFIFSECVCVCACVCVGGGRKVALCGGDKMFWWEVKGGRSDAVFDRREILDLWVRW
jgi:hypothetical protein